MNFINLKLTYIMRIIINLRINVGEKNLKTPDYILYIIENAFFNYNLYFLKFFFNTYKMIKKKYFLYIYYYNTNFVWGPNRQRWRDEPPPSLAIKLHVKLTCCACYCSFVHGFASPRHLKPSLDMYILLCIVLRWRYDKLKKYTIIILLII